MSSTPKVKLPSIAELTSQLVLPKSSLDTLPLLLIFRAPLPHTGHLPLALLDQLVMVPFHPANQPQYQYYSSNVPPPGFYQHASLHKVYYQPVAGATLNYQPQAAKSYSVAEVINKPMNKCHRCGTTETPEWRRGPNGLRTLCNACGLFHAKLVKRKGAVLAAEEVLNNKVCKGKNGRRVSIKKQAMDESKKRMKEAQVTEIPPIPYAAPSGFDASPSHRVSAPPAPHHMAFASAPGTEYLYHVQPGMGSIPLLGLAWGPRLELPGPLLTRQHQSLPPLRN